MSDRPCTDWKEVTNKIALYFFKTVTTLIVCITVIVGIYLILFAITSNSSNDVFELEESRLAKQLTVLIEDKNPYGSDNLSADQRLKIIQSVVDKYDPATDSLKPTINENAKQGISMIEILSHFKISKDGKQVELIKELDTNKGKTQWE